MPDVKLTFCVLVLALSACTYTGAEYSAEHEDKVQVKKKVMQLAETGEVCQNFGPQTPRDLANVVGENTVIFPIAPAFEQLNLCNIHFHNAAEHKAPAFSIPAAMTAEGHGGGYQCGISKELTSAELKPFENNQCGDVQPGDTVEVHWVHTSCDVEPGPGLGSCLSDSCANPSLRVETQVFTVVNNKNAMDFSDFDFSGQKKQGKYQANSIPTGTGTPIEFLGSTTGPKYTEQSCSPLQVSWSVRPECAKVDIASLSSFCANNDFQEDHAHGVRKLVVNPKLLAPIKN